MQSGFEQPTAITIKQLCYNANYVCCSWRPIMFNRATWQPQHHAGHASSDPNRCLLQICELSVSPFVMEDEGAYWFTSSADAERPIRLSPHLNRKEQCTLLGKRCPADHLNQDALTQDVRRLTVKAEQATMKQMTHTFVCLTSKRICFKNANSELRARGEVHWRATNPIHQFNKILVTFNWPYGGHSI